MSRLRECRDFLASAAAPFADSEGTGEEFSDIQDRLWVTMVECECVITRKIPSLEHHITRFVHGGGEGGPHTECGPPVPHGGRLSRLEWLHLAVEMKRWSSRLDEIGVEICEAANPGAWPLGMRIRALAEAAVLKVHLEREFTRGFR